MQENGKKIVDVAIISKQEKDRCPYLWKTWEKYSRCLFPQKKKKDSRCYHEKTQKKKKDSRCHDHEEKDSKCRYRKKKDSKCRLREKKGKKIVNVVIARKWEKS